VQPHEAVEERRPGLPHSVGGLHSALKERPGSHLRERRRRKVGECLAIRQGWVRYRCEACQCGQDWVDRLLCANSLCNENCLQT
jgi:hypothetical protein